MTLREAHYDPVHDDDSDGDISNSYGLEYQDTLEDEVKQALLDGSIDALVTELCKERTEQQAKEVIATILCMLLECDKPRLMVQCICIAIGFNTLINGKSGAQLGTEYGMTRQNVAEIVKKVRFRLGLHNKTRTAKSDRAKASYKRFNRVREKEIK